MRTKTLLLTAALAVAGAATSMAQVYSVNAVGYVNLTIGKGFSIIANPLKAADNSVAAVIAAPPENTVLYIFTNGKYKVDSFSSGSWDDGTESILPGQGFFIRNQSDAAFTLTFVGEVMQGTLSTPIPAGFSLISSQVPQSGALDTDLGLVFGENDVVYQFVSATQKYAVDSFSGGTWDTDPVHPTVAVGEGFFYKNNNAATTWNRTFSVNQ